MKRVESGAQGARVPAAWGASRTLAASCLMALVVAAGHFLGIAQVSAHRADEDAGAGTAALQSAFVSLEKSTNGVDADFAPGPEVVAGSPVTWEYDIKNPTDDDLIFISVSDDPEGLIDCPQSSLGPNEVMTCTHFGTAVEGQYRNEGVLVFARSGGGTGGRSDVSHYLGTPGPRALKTMAIELLQGISPTYDPRALDRIDRAIRWIEHSLDRRLWLGEHRPNPRRGGRIFDREGRAVHELQRLFGLDDDDSDDSSGDSSDDSSDSGSDDSSGRAKRPILTPEEEQAILGALMKLVEADDALADAEIGRALQAAFTAGCNDPDSLRRRQRNRCRRKLREITRAQNELARARLEARLQNYAKAIERYKRAWQRARRAR